MSHPVEHAKSSARKFGGSWLDYLEIHEWFDATKAWSTGNAPAAIASEFNNLAKSASQAASFVTAKAGELGAVGQQAVNAVGTVKRAGLDKALTSILGDPKIPTPGFGR